MIRWQSVLAAAVLATMIPWAAAIAAPSDSAKLDVRTTASGTGEVHVYINGKDVTAKDTASATGGTYLGVMAAPLTAKAKEAAKVETGVVVTAVMPGSPASKADIRADDVITAVEDTAITSPQNLADRVREYKPGDKVKMVWFRDGKRMQETVTLAALPTERPSTMPRMPDTKGEAPKAKTSEPFLGVVAGPMTDEMKEFSKIDHGVLVESLSVDSPAAKAGLQAGDVITAIDGKDINAPKALVDLVRSHKPGDTIHVTYYRMSKRADATVTLGERPGEAARPKEPSMPGVSPDDLEGMSPEMRKYLDNLRPEIEEWMRRYGNPDMSRPGARPLTPPGSPASPGTSATPYDVGKDLGRILERLDRMEHRLTDIEKRLDQIEKK